MKRPSGRYALLAEASAVGILFPLSLVAGYWAGSWVGALFGLRPAAAFVGAALGVAFAFWNLYRLLRRLEGSPGGKS